MRLPGDTASSLRRRPAGPRLRQSSPTGRRPSPGPTTYRRLPPGFNSFAPSISARYPERRPRVKPDSRRPGVAGTGLDSRADRHVRRRNLAPVNMGVLALVAPTRRTTDQLMPLRAPLEVLGDASVRTRATTRAPKPTSRSNMTTVRARITRPTSVRARGNVSRCTCSSSGSLPHGLPAGRKPAFDERGDRAGKRRRR
jgi:hypothetical protein